MRHVMCYNDRAAIKWLRELSSYIIRIGVMKIQHVFRLKTLAILHIDRPEVM